MALSRSEKGPRTAKKDELTLDRTERFLAVPVRLAGSSSQARHNMSLCRHLASLERICGN